MRELRYHLEIKEESNIGILCYLCSLCCVCWHYIQVVSEWMPWCPSQLSRRKSPKYMKKWHSLFWAVVSSKIIIIKYYCIIGTEKSWSARATWLSKCPLNHPVLIYLSFCNNSLAERFFPLDSELLWSKDGAFFFNSFIDS